MIESTDRCSASSVFVPRGSGRSELGVLVVCGRTGAVLQFIEESVPILSSCDECHRVIFISPEELISPVTVVPETSSSPCSAFRALSFGPCSYIVESSVTKANTKLSIIL